MATLDKIIFILTILASLGSGLIAGAFFAFSTFVMRALGKLPANEGMTAMQSINVVVINPWFMIVFLGTALASLLLAVFSLVRWSGPGSGYILIGCLLYFVGTFLVTMFLNVPLNNALAAANAGTSEGADVWANYLVDWTFWNHVRTIAALCSTASFIFGLIYRTAQS